MSEVEGWLLVQAPTSNGGFDKKWCVLTKENTLFYYTDDAMSESGTEIVLDDCSVEIVPDGKFKNCFELTAPAQDAVFVMAAENGTAQQEWINAVRRAMLRIRRSKAKSARAAIKSEQAAAAAAAEQEQQPSTSSQASTDVDNYEEPPMHDEYAQYVSPSIASDEVEDDDKYDVYRKWLEETNNPQQNTSAGDDGSDGSLHFLLREDHKKNSNCCGCVIL